MTIARERCARCSPSPDQHRSHTTGKRDLGEAEKAAAQIYANVLVGRWTGPEQVRPSVEVQSLDVLVASWVESIETALDETGASCENVPWQEHRALVRLCRASKLKTKSTSTSKAKWRRCAVSRVAT
jgi:hypothetical protein